MSRGVASPVFPAPPAQYDQQYMATLVRAFATYAEQIKSAKAMPYKLPEASAEQDGVLMWDPATGAAVISTNGTWVPVGIPPVTGNALEFLRVNAGATALEYLTPAQTHAALLVDRNAATVGGTADARTVTTGLGLTLATGLRVRAVIPAANTTAMTLDVDGTGAVTVKTVTGADTPNLYIRTDVPTDFYYDGTNWIADRALESGVSSDVQWRRWANGTLEVWNPGIAGSASAETTWTFPSGVTFLNNNSMVALGNCRTSAGVLRAVGFSGNSTTAQAFSVYNAATSARTADVAEIYVIGRWY